jgi:hypothetical protein
MPGMGRHADLRGFIHIFYPHVAWPQAFILEHEYYGELDAGVEDDRVWMSRMCGAVIVRALEPAAP